MGILLRGLEQELEKIEDNFAKNQFIIFRHIGFYTKYIAEAKRLSTKGTSSLQDILKSLLNKKGNIHQIVNSVLSDLFGGQISKDQLKVLTLSCLDMQWDLLLVRS